MANQNPYQIHGQNKGTLVPGQSIAVGQFNVQVERYLSQGGFAHVYLVRTATPVYNTTHHVLKRIAVDSEGMLTEVKKEVDVMRLLKGHPNIVHLIDAAWSKMANGTYEVFILMEYCPGGGIIDMMNRRLRERLTEAEILQIFADVCEGVAFMHSSRPPLLHRDLKVENILQSSPTSFKLCDFGSATYASPRPPSTAQEIRALEADLNRHTTLQYRAPEMVDLYLRRPVDEKSDVWALGVLLYKLCYYTTPFEEHGPLAILNVQYKTPPYPVYSNQMNALIASMLREHGVHRPTVFEVLDQVHRLRGTKSQFKYNIPSPQPLSPKHASSKNASGFSTSKPPQQISTSPPVLNGTSSSTTSSKNAGVQAREMVLEAIAPMRRGRPAASKDANEPSSSSSTRPASPHKPTTSTTARQPEGTKPSNNWLDSGFDAEEEKAWKAIAATKAPEHLKPSGDDAWTVKTSANSDKPKDQGFGDDFGQKLWDSFDPQSAKPKNTDTSSNAASTSHYQPLTPSRTPGLTPSGVVRPRLIPSKSKERDAFEGLGLQPNSRPLPTLGEARKLRTGLAVLSTQSNRSDTYRPPSSPSTTRNTYLAAQSQPMRGASSSPARTTPQPSASPAASPIPPPIQTPSADLPAESRFPSLEELDASFGTGASSKQPPVIGIRAGAQLSGALQAQEARSSLDIDVPKAESLKPVRLPSYNGGSRSAQVTGSAMRSTQITGDGASSADIRRVLRAEKDTETPQEAHKGAAAPKSAKIPSPEISGQRPNTTTSFNYTGSKFNSHRPSPSEAPDKPIASKPTRSTTDWLTGSDNEQLPSISPRTPLLRASPNKRSSYLEAGSRTTQVNEIARRTSPTPLSSSIGGSPPKPTATRSRLPSLTQSKPPTRLTNINTTGAKYNPAEALSDNWSPLPSSRKATDNQKDLDAQSSPDEDGPEDPARLSRPSKMVSGPQKTRHKARQSSVHDLVDLWGGGISSGADGKEHKKDLVAPLSNLETSRLSPSKRTSVNLSSPAVTSFPRSASPKPTGIDSRQTSQGTDASDVGRPQPSPVAPTPSPSSGRSRPQSMFIFPSRASDALGSGHPSAPALSSSLSPPVDLPKRPTRRTSISDMVQHYEAINKTGLGPPPIATKPQEFKALRPSNVRKVSADVISLSQSQRPALQPISPTSPPQSDSPRKPIQPSNLSAPPSDVTPRRTSPTITEGIAPIGRRQAEKDEAKAFDEAVSKLKKATGNDEGNQSPPDQPYRGVGRLIDQWQRKTAEVEGTTPGAPRRGGFVAKRGTALTSASGKS
ncbi:hypothetical protein PC9H_003239 [Pleurotus ostreatus]|uniref:non-specific serine/threonine protein kinase n=1 Tax=Pleurotus ostreatus TaxID=5322 RepID=A0A8H7A1Z7_PLEOS|nr:uncharacterized protein PC9H_003239 [Pleurotus ostreatus]KAF7436406.1 hypothetical protein PC9H_003239 [Pleurotus ostreatus]KAJ8702102.1 Ark- serine/threonine protein kinase [Pleurotus ostreatus]